MNRPSRSKAATSPPASRMARAAARLRRRRFSAASFSRRALVLELPLGATPVRIFLPSCGVKLTKPTREAGVAAAAAAVAGAGAGSFAAAAAKYSALKVRCIGMRRGIDSGEGAAAAVGAGIGGEMEEEEYRGEAMAEGEEKWRMREGRRRWALLLLLLSWWWWW